MKTRYPSDTLTPEERKIVTTLVNERGWREAAKAFGISDKAALFGAAAGIEVSRLTIGTIRGRLDRI